MEPMYACPTSLQRLFLLARSWARVQLDPEAKSVLRIRSVWVGTTAEESRASKLLLSTNPALANMYFTTIAPRVLEHRIRQKLEHHQ